MGRCTKARITVIPDDAWDGALGELHPRVVDRTYGRVDNILAVHSLSPRSMAAHQGLYESAMAGRHAGDGSDVRGGSLR